MQQILNFGSLNIDHVYQVEHIVRPGETLATHSYEMFAGGKGANQSTALALAGASVRHGGCIGADGVWLRDGLAEAGVDVTGIRIEPSAATGHAVIQVETDGGENAIFLHAGSNNLVSDEQIHTTFENQEPSTILLLQNEINNLPKLIHEASSRGWAIALNPAPFDDSLHELPLELVDLFIINETEAAGLAGLPADAPSSTLLERLRQRWPAAAFVLTLGARGALYCGTEGAHHIDALRPGPVVDTTAAGDTFIGYFVAGMASGKPPETCLQQAAAAAGLCVTRHGARAAIPRLEQVEAFLASIEPGIADVREYRTDP